MQQAPIAPVEVTSSEHVIPSAPSTATSLYVGDLHPTVTEQMLHEKFYSAGPISSVRVCRDAITRHSLGYGYVNFHHHNDAKSAIATMNFDALAGKPMRLMWSQRDPTVRRSGAANIFIKNLEKSIDTKSIYDTFTMFGPILSCKVATDERGVSKGYGFIHFEHEESANKAIEKVNGMELENSVVYVTKFLPRSVRVGEMSLAAANFTNCYVDNFGEELDDAALAKLFAAYGEIKSSTVMKRKDEGGNEQSRGFGFVDFHKHEDAVKAVEALHDFVLPGSERKLTVCRFQRKTERQAAFRELLEKKKIEHYIRYQGINVYVKNLDDCFSDDSFLRKTFEPYGTVTSAKIMLDEAGRSKGFGFVSFERPEDAQRAIGVLHNKMLGTKPLYVAPAQPKEERKKKLEHQHWEALRQQQQQQQRMVQAPVYTSNGYYVPAPMQPALNFVPVPSSLPGGLQPQYGQWGGAGGMGYPVSTHVGYPLQGDGAYVNPQAGRGRY